MHDGKIRKEMLYTTTRTNRLLGNAIRSNWSKQRERGLEINYSGQNDTAKTKQANINYIIKSIQPIIATQEELRTKAYARIDRLAKEMTVEQLYGLLIELVASIERVTMWIMIKTSPTSKNGNT